MKLSEALRKGCEGKQQIQTWQFGMDGQTPFNYLPRNPDGTIDHEATKGITGCCAMGAIALGCADGFTAPVESDKTSAAVGFGETHLIRQVTGVDIANIRVDTLPAYNIGITHDLDCAITRLNDNGWSFEQIIGWLESIGQ